MVRSAKSTQSPTYKYGAPTLCKYMVSGLFHSPERGSFHLSLTVLVHYRSINIFSLRSLVLPDSNGLVVSRSTQVYADTLRISFSYGTLTLYGRAFQPRSPRQIHKSYLAFINYSRINLQPRTYNTFMGYYIRAVWAVPFSLATTKRM